MSKGLFITATDTDAGKTFVTSHIVAAFRKYGIHAGYYKAALSGAYYEGDKLIPGDAKEVLTRAGLKEDYNQCVSYTFHTPVSPHLAAQIEKQSIQLTKIEKDYKAICKRYDLVTVEGSGGIVCPIQVNGEEVGNMEASRKPFIGFDMAAGRIYGNSGCNRMMGTFSVDSLKPGILHFF